MSTPSEPQNAADPFEDAPTAKRPIQGTLQALLEEALEEADACPAESA